MTEKQSNFLIALGGNLPSAGASPASTIGSALRRLAGRGLMIRTVSRFFETPCFPAGSGPDYVNAAACVAAPPEPAGLLAHLHAVEAEFGRNRDTRWGARTLDLDLLACGDAVLPDRETQTAWMALEPERRIRSAPDALVLPHPRLHERAFVLVPLCDIAPDWVHPVLGQSAAALCAALEPAEIAAVRPI